MLSNTALKILQTLVHRGIFQDVYEGASLIISLLPHPAILHRYVESIQSLDPLISSPSPSSELGSLSQKPDPTSGAQEKSLLTSKSQSSSIENRSTSPSEAARQAIQDLDI